MPDSVFLTGPQGTQLNLGSWLRADPGPNYGVRDLVRQQFAQSDLLEGARLAYETAAGPRRMEFPLLLASGGAGLSLDGLEATLRLVARPGGYVDLQPDGVPTAEMVRFDIVGGRVNHDDDNVHLTRSDLRRVTIDLDTQPYGYWPTWILLASHSGDSPFRASIPAGAILGDAPGLARLRVAPSQIANASYLVDAVAWSFGGKPSFRGQLDGASWGAQGSYQANSFAFGGTQALQFLIPNNTQWSNTHFYRVASGLLAAYRGRFRAYALLNSPGGLPLQVSLDATPSGFNMALASAGIIATLPPTALDFHMLDLGEITMPRAIVASGRYEGPQEIRLWAKASNAATTQVNCGGVYLQPVDDGQAGVLARGVGFPSINNYNTLQVEFGEQGVVGLSASVGVADLGLFHYGPRPLVAPSVTGVDVMLMQRHGVGASGQLLLRRTSQVNTLTHLYYRPRFQFLKGI